jgi:alkaline phosphatase
MMRFILVPSLFLLSLMAGAQEHSASSIFAHNDYVHPIPFFTSYNLQVGFIEADVFLVKGDLMVAHKKSEIDDGRTLGLLYLDPLNKLVQENNGSVYADPLKTLTLMIDLKTEGTATLNVLVAKLKQYPKLTGCNTLTIAVSGNMPNSSEWINFPDFINFDGRPGISYSIEQLKRVRIVSTNFRNYSHWNGKTKMTDADKNKLLSIINDAHAKGKSIRFWAIPDFEQSWIDLIKLNVDIINTDDVSGLADFIDKSNAKKN